MNPLSVFIASILCTSQLAVAHKVVIFDKEIDLSPAFAKLSQGNFVAEDPSAADEKCLQETEQLAAAPSLVAATNNLEQCPIEQSIDGTAVKVSQDFATCPQANGYQGACEAAGGQVDTISALSIDCTIWSNGITLTLNILTENVPACVGNSCTGSLDEFLADEEVREELANEVVDLFASEGLLADCIAGNGSPSAPAAFLIKVSKKLASAGGLRKAEN